ncbi:putative mitochondrial protein [Rosellinia necatrix]|uniref:Putative mitochondrial protein n=1 Tax=Rosellinia necatrix TaxID=77044 RepID=A0A1W2TFW0_ROSNE|nr:putative mitochondrial protein [Rosellinia necatrix]
MIAPDLADPEFLVSSQPASHGDFGMRLSGGIRGTGEEGQETDRDQDHLYSSELPSLLEPPLPATESTSGRQQQYEERQHTSITQPPLPPLPPPAPQPSPDMSKLTDAVKALINASHARPGYTRAGAQVKPALELLASDAQEKNVGLPAWVTVSTAVSATMNCPEAMTEIFHLANTRSATSRTPVQNAELIREVGLKCISFNGIPRSINTLGAFWKSLPEPVSSSLSTTPTRKLTAVNLGRRQAGGRALWDNVYLGFETKLLDRLAQSHPDLPVHILDGHYSSLLGNPRDAATAAIRPEPVGRVLTSLVAVACLRAQTGVGPQVVSHIFGLRKAYKHGAADAPGELPVEGGEWLAGDDGNIWLLESIDKLAHAIGGGEGTTFAPGIRPKL